MHDPTLSWGRRSPPSRCLISLSSLGDDGPVESYLNHSEGQTNSTCTIVKSELHAPLAVETMSVFRLSEGGRWRTGGQEVRRKREMNMCFFGGLGVRWMAR